MIHHFIDHVDLGDDGLLPGDLHQGPNVTDSQTNQEVHDDNWEQEDIGSKEQVGSAWGEGKVLHFQNNLTTMLPSNWR